MKIPSSHLFGRFLTAVMLTLGATAGAREFYDLRVYHFRSEESAALFDAAMKESGLAALEKAGITTVGVFRPRPGPDVGPVADRYLLLAAPTPGLLAEQAGVLAGGPGAGEALRAYQSTPPKEPAYTRIESTLLRAFRDFPAVADPAGDGGGDRFFELRTYQSHDELRARLKVEMFNEGGELGIFRETGLRGVFFGEALIGTELPKLAYMLVHEGDEEKKRAWDAFQSAPAWDRLKKDPRFADTVSKIDVRFLVAMPYSPLR